MDDPQEEEICCSLIQNSEAESADDFTAQCFCFNSVLYEAAHNPPIASSTESPERVTSTGMHSAHHPHSVLAQGLFGGDLKMCHFCILSLNLLVHLLVSSWNFFFF